MKRQQFVTRLVSFAVLIILEAASLCLITNNSSLQRIWVSKAGHSFMGTVWGASQGIRNYFSLSETNKQLSQENYELRRELDKANVQLRQMNADSAVVSSRPGFEMIPAEVVKISRNKQHNYLILNKGYADGIKENSGVVARGGVIGIVDAISEHHCFAFSFQNSDVSISARIGSEGSSGLLIWDGIHNAGAILKELPLQSKYSPGDTVYTSGHSLLFPPDIPLGIAGKAKVVNGATNQVSVSLFQDFSAIRYVTVVHNDAFDEIEEFME